MMRTHVFRLCLPVLLCALAAAGPAFADGDAAPEPKAAPAVSFDPKNFELLPLNDIERAKLNREHPTIVQRLQYLGKRSAKLDKQYQDRKNKRDDGSKKLLKERDRVRAQVGKLMATALETLEPYGVNTHVLELIEQAPQGPARVERYAQRLVLALPSLDDVQREMFEEIVAQVDGAYLALQAERNRLDLALKQSGLDRGQINALVRTTDQQRRVIEKRFWRLVDYCLTTEQRVALKDLLPTRYARVENGIEHMYGLPGLSPSQGTRLRALVTEVQAENAPDQALVRAHGAALNKRDLSKEERATLNRERGEAYRRMQTLNIFLNDSVREVLTEEQYLAYKAIPPRVSTNDRREALNRMLQGMPISAAQRDDIRKLQREFSQERREINQRMNEIRRKGADYGPDSPQQGMMQMMMAGAQAESQAAMRRLIGRVFLDVFTPDQVSGWVLGLYGRRK